VAINELYQPAMVESKKDQLNADIYIIGFIETSILGDGYGYRQMKELARYRRNGWVRGAGASLRCSLVK